jgi:hypothetical protein
LEFDCFYCSVAYDLYGVGVESQVAAHPSCCVLARWRVIFASFLLLVTTTAFVGACTAVPAEGRVQSVAGTVPTLEILSPKDGETITPPTAVRFAVTGFTLAEGGGHIEVFVRGVADSPGVALQTSEEPGLAYLPANKLFSGRRDLTFALARTDGTLLENPEARVTIYGLTIVGGR